MRSPPATVIGRALPLAHDDRRLRARVIHATVPALLCLWLVYFTYVLMGVGLGAETFFRTYVFSGLPILAAAVCLTRALSVESERMTWMLIGTGMLLWACGSIYWSAVLKQLHAPPYPSPAEPCT
jgi:hypothetical protein